MRGTTGMTQSVLLAGLLCMSTLAASRAAGQGGTPAAESCCGAECACGLTPSSPLSAADRSVAIVARCTGAGMTTNTMSAILAPVRDATRAGLPSAHVLDKIEEGLAKTADADSIVAAAQNRLEYLAAARSVVGEGPASCARGEQRLLVSVALALESGMPRALIDAAIEAGEGERPGRLSAVVGAGESLHLAGRSAEDVKQFMLSCVARDLGRGQIVKAVKEALKGP